jgi:hypothetical protein
MFRPSKVHFELLFSVTKHIPFVLNTNSSLIWCQLFTVWPNYLHFSAYGACRVAFLNPSLCALNSGTSVWAYFSPRLFCERSFLHLHRLYPQQSHQFRVPCCSLSHRWAYTFLLLAKQKSHHCFLGYTLPFLLNSIVFLDVTLCSPVEVQHFRGTVDFYQSTQCLYLKVKGMLLG